MLDSVLRTIPHDEIFLKRLAAHVSPLLKLQPGQLPPVVLHTPPHADPQDTLNRLALLADRRFAYHQQWYRLAWLCMPLSIAFALVPLPNIPLLFNAWRLVSHYGARKGALYLITMVSPTAFGSLSFRDDMCAVPPLTRDDVHRDEVYTMVRKHLVSVYALEDGLATMLAQQTVRGFVQEAGRTAVNVTSDKSA